MSIADQVALLHQQIDLLNQQILQRIENPEPHAPDCS